MKSKAEILAENPDLISYQVMLHEETNDQGEKGEKPGNETSFAFDCFAQDDDHAVEQAKNAYPKCEVLSTTAHAGNDEGVKDLESQIDLYRDNKMAILGVLEELDVEFVTVCYLGRGDYRAEPFITAGDPSSMISKAAFSDDILVTYQTEDGMAENSLNRLLDIFTQTVLSNLGHGDYDVDAGGNGELKISVNSGLIEVVHHENEEDQRYTHFDFSDSGNCSAVFESNKNVAIAALRSAGVKLVNATYVGGGNSGEISSIECSNDGGEVDVSAIAVIYQRAEETFDPAGWSVVAKEKSGSLGDLIFQLTNDVVNEIDRAGYQNNEGGGGTLTFDLGSSHASFVSVSHYDNEIEVTTFRYTLTDEGLAQSESQDDALEFPAPSN